ASSRCSLFTTSRPTLRRLEESAPQPSRTGVGAPDSVRAPTPAIRACPKDSDACQGFCPYRRSRNNDRPPSARKNDRGTAPATQNDLPPALYLCRHRSDSTRLPVITATRV